MARRSVLAKVSQARPARAAGAIGQARPARPRIGLGQARPAGGGGSQSSGGGGGGGTAPPPAAQAPAAQPWDAQAERESGAAGRKFGDTYADITGGWNAREEWYGYGETSNPYSQAALLSHRHDVDNRTVLNSANNQLYAGSTVNRHQAADRRFSIDSEALKAAFEAERAKKDRELQQAEHEYGDEIAGIREGPILRAEELEPAPAPASGGGSSGSPGGTIGKGAKGKTKSKGKSYSVGIGGGAAAGGGKKRKGR